MKLITHTTPCMIIADEGKRIKHKNINNTETDTDENGKVVENYLPYYSTVIFVPSSFTKSDMENFYTEEVNNE